MHRLALLSFILAAVGFSFGCKTDDGFYYPEAGLVFRPHGKVEAGADYGVANLVENSRYEVLVPPTLILIDEHSEQRIIATGIKDLWTVRERPLYDEVAITYYNEYTWCNYKLVEKRQVDVPWRGLYPPQGTLRIFHLTSKRVLMVRGCGGCCRPVADTAEQYTYAITVYHNGNTIEFCWREDNPMLNANRKMNDLFAYTKGVMFVRSRTYDDSTPSTESN